jgi:putative addiction module CopG family antidote
MEIQVRIDPSLHGFIDDKIRGGEYASVEEVVHAGLDALRQQDVESDFEPGELDALLEVGERSVREGGTISADAVFEEYRDRGRTEST